MREKEGVVGDTNDPDFQKGVFMGFQAQNPLSRENLTEGIGLNRNHFLNGYLRGLKQYLASKEIILPWDINIETNIVQPYFLLGYSHGLERKNPNIPDNIFGEKDENLGEEGNIYRASIEATENTLKTEGYIIGFIVSVAKDFDLTLDQHDIPTDDHSYEVFMAGYEGRTFASVPQPNQNVEWASDFDKDVADLLRRRKYEAGMKIWLRKHKLDINIASEFTDNPQKLEDLKRKNS